MSTRKTALAKTAPILPSQTKLAEKRSEPTQHKLLEDIEVTSLTVDDGYDLGGDPYNSTGQFAALQARNKK